MSFERNEDVIIASCARWVEGIIGIIVARADEPAETPLAPASIIEGSLIMGVTTTRSGDSTHWTRHVPYQVLI